MSSKFNMNKSATGCNLCGERHVIQNQCSREAMAKQIGLLRKRVEIMVEANKNIPGIIQSANDFKALAKDAAIVIGIMEEVCMKTEQGKVIWGDFKKKLEENWEKASLNRGISELNRSAEHTTQNANEDKTSTMVTTDGETTAPSSSQ